MTPDDSVLPYHREAIEKNYIRFITLGFVEPVVVGYDVCDERAKAMAIEQFGEQAVIAKLDAKANAGEPSILFAFLTSEQANARLRKYPGFEHIAEFTSQGFVPVMIISGGIGRWYGMPKPGRES